MRYAIVLITLFAIAACSKDEESIPPCIQVPNTTISLEDSLMVINCNDFELGVHVDGENEYYDTVDSDTLYLYFDTTGTFTLVYYNVRQLAANPPFFELPIHVK